MVVRGLCVLCPLSRVATVPNYVPTRQFNCKAVQPTRVLALLCRLSPHVVYLTFLPYTIVLACKILFTCSPMNILGDLLCNRNHCLQAVKWSSMQLSSASSKSRVLEFKTLTISFCNFYNHKKYLLMLNT